MITDVLAGEVGEDTGAVTEIMPGPIPQQTVPAYPRGRITASGRCPPPRSSASENPPDLVVPHVVTLIIWHAKA